MRLTAITLVVLLSACATQPQVVTHTKVQEVPVVVTQRCIDAKDIPERPKTHMDPEGDVQQKAAGAVLDLRALDLYIDRLLALLNNCAT